jgi:hypothetical protein
VGLGLGLGDEIEYLDDGGKILKVRLVAGLAGSPFQGRLVVSESVLLRRFPTSAFPRLLLANSPPGRSADLAMSLELSPRLSMRPSR